MIKNKNLYYLALSLVLIFSACKDDDEELPGQPPTVNAGQDVTATAGSAVQLSGTATDPDGDPLTISWSVTSAPQGSSATINNPSSLTASFTPDLVGNYTLRLSADDGIYDPVTDELIITAEEAVGEPPIAVIRNESAAVINEENNEVTINTAFILNGSQSSDPDSETLTFAWQITEGPEDHEATLTPDENGITASFTPNIVGTYTIQLTVTDPDGNADTETVSLVATANPVLISNDITADRVLIDVFPDNPELPDYRVTRDINVDALLTVNPGVTIEFVEDAFLNIRSGGGALIAIGEEENKITFTTANLAGEIRWGGIYITSTDSRNAISHAIVTYAGGRDIGGFADFVDVPANIGLSNGGRLSITNTEVSFGGGYGMYDRYGDISAFSDNHFHDNSNGIGLPIYNASAIDESTVFENNTNGAVEIFGSTLNGDPMTINSLSGDAHYYVSGNITIASNLSIQPGADFRMASNVFWIFGENATVTAQGVEGDSISFDAQSANNKWGGIKFASIRTDNVFDYIKIVNAGSQAMIEFADFVDVPANLGMYANAQLSLTNSVISNGDGYGIYVRNGEFLNFADNRLSANALYGIGLDVEQVNAMDAASIFTNNTEGAIEVFGGTLTDEASTWVALAGGAQYVFTGDVVIQRALTINPGASFVFNSNIGMEINESASFIAVGTADSTITFTSAEQGTFRWQGIYINSTTMNNQLDYVEISYGGSETYRFDDFVNARVNLGIGTDVEVNISNCVISNSAGYGIYSDGTANADVEEAASGNTFSDNPEGNRF